MALATRFLHPFHQFWLSKLTGFDYIIQYKSRSENLVVDAILRVTDVEVSCLALSVLDSNSNQLSNKVITWITIFNICCPIFKMVW